MMSWQNLGHYTISAGETLWIPLTFAGGAPFSGVLYFSARPLNPNARLVFANQYIKVDVNGYYSYGLTVKNEGPSGTVFLVEGGNFALTGELSSKTPAIDPNAIYVSPSLISAKGPPQYIAVTPGNPGSSMRMLGQIVVGNYGGPVSYLFQAINDGPFAAFGLSAGGSLDQVMDFPGSFTLAPGASMRILGWDFIPNSYMSSLILFAIPVDVGPGEIVALISTEQVKVQLTDGTWVYGLTVSNQEYIKVGVTAKFKVVGGVCF